MRTWHGVVCLILVLFLSCASNPEAQKGKLLATGNAYLERGKFREASLLFRRAIQVDRRYGEAYYRLGVAESSLGRYAEALRAFQRAVDLLPDNSEAFDRLADLYLTAYQTDPERFSKFLDDLEALAKRAETHQVSPLAVDRARGFLELARRNVQQGIELLRKAYSLDPSDRRVVLGLAAALSGRGDYAEAERIAMAALQKDPSFRAAYDFLYAHYLRQGKEDEAALVIRRKCESDPKNIDSWLQLAAHYHRAGELRQRDDLLNKLSGNPGEYPEGHLAVGDFCIRIGNLDAAIQHYEAGAAADPARRPVYRLRAANALGFEGRVSEALAIVDEILRDNPADDQARHLWASLAVSRGGPESVQKATRELEALAKRMPENPVLRYNLGRAYAASGDLDRAAVEYQKAAKTKDYLPPRYELGRLALANQKYGTAKQLAGEILQVQPFNIAGGMLGATAHAGLRESKQARGIVEAILARQPANRDALYLLAQLSLQDKNYLEAGRILKRLSQDAPQDLRSTHELVGVYLAQGRADLACDLLDRQIAKHPESTELRLAKADLAVRNNNYDIAFQTYNSLLTGSKADVRIRERMGTAYYRKRDFAAAEEQYRKGRELDPADVASNLRLALLLGELGRRDEAKPFLEHVLQLDPENTVALNNMAFLLLDSPAQLDRALALAQRAFRQAPDSATIADTLGWIYLKKNFSDGAIKIYEDLAVKQPSCAKWRYHLAMAFAQKGDKSQARMELRKALGNQPTKEEEQKIRQLLARQ